MKYGIVIIENRFEDSKVKNHIDKHKKFLPEGWGSFYIKDEKIKTLSDYNKLLTSKEFWEVISFDKVLVTQMDAEILRSGIEEFLEYDYVGAPWKFQGHGGNGGFSLRSKNVMLDIIEKYPYQGAGSHGYEDVYFSNHIEKVGGKLAPRVVCEKFSCESIFELGTLGAHAIDKWLTIDQCKLIRGQK